jgi:hypothetical protein
MSRSLVATGLLVAPAAAYAYAAGGLYLYFIAMPLAMLASILTTSHLFSKPAKSKETPSFGKAADAAADILGRVVVFMVFTVAYTLGILFLFAGVSDLLA